MEPIVKTPLNYKIKHWIWQAITLVVIGAFVFLIPLTSDTQQEELELKAEFEDGSPVIAHTLRKKRSYWLNNMGLSQGQEAHDLTGVERRSQ